MTGDRETDRQIDRETEKQRDRESGRQEDRQTIEKGDRDTGREMGETDRLDRQGDRSQGDG